MADTDNKPSGDREPSGDFKPVRKKSKTGRYQCMHVIQGKYGESDRQCKHWAAAGSEYCSRHGAAIRQAAMEKNVQNGKHLQEDAQDSPVGFRRVLSGRFEELWEAMLLEMPDDDLSHELATLRAALATQLEETCSRYAQWKEEADKQTPENRVDYWNAYNSMLTRIRQTTESIRKTVQTVSDIRNRQEGNSISMVQLVAVVGEIVTAMTEIIGDDTEKLEALRSAIERIEWLK